MTNGGNSNQVFQITFQNGRLSLRPIANNELDRAWFAVRSFGFPDVAEITAAEMLLQTISRNCLGHNHSPNRKSIPERGPLAPRANGTARITPAQGAF